MPLFTRAMHSGSAMPSGQDAQLMAVLARAAVLTTENAKLFESLKALEQTDEEAFIKYACA